MSEKLVWKDESRRVVFSTPVFNVEEHLCRSPENNVRAYTILDTRDWAMVIPVLESAGSKKFVMVRQWRHGAKELSLEFPGGVFEPGENAETAAARELREETGYDAECIEKLGDMNPNPAIMSNRIHFFLATKLKPPLPQMLDEDEFVETEIIPCGEVTDGLGKAPYIHALIGTALALYMKKEFPQR